MNDKETVNERRERENAERIAEYQRATARPRVATREDIIGPSRDLFERRKQEESERMDAHRRAQTVALLTRTLGRTPTDAEIASALAR